MLLAYIDEIGETGAFVSRNHPNFNTSPAFGYAGFVLPESAARVFGQAFTEEKRKLFAAEIAASSHPAQWERKGATLFHPHTVAQYPQQLRVFNGLIRRLRSLGGQLFYYADEKPIGTPNQTKLDTISRESGAMKEALNRLARHADERDSNLLVLIDQVNEMQRIQRMPTMYAHMFARSTQFEEMKRIVEPPMHVDSALSSNIQFADWIAACVSRAIDYQLIEQSAFAWITRKVNAVQGAFTHQSKVHLWNRAANDFHHSQLFLADRPLYPVVDGSRIGNMVDEGIQRRIRANADNAQHYVSKED